VRQISIEKLMDKFKIRDRERCRRYLSVSDKIPAEKLVADFSQVEKLGRSEPGLIDPQTGAFIITEKESIVVGMGDEFDLDKALESKRPDPEKVAEQFLKKSGIKRKDIQE